MFFLIFLNILVLFIDVFFEKFNIVLWCFVDLWYVNFFFDFFNSLLWVGISCRSIVKLKFCVKFMNLIYGLLGLISMVFYNDSFYVYKKLFF